jgi:hypothetical protein
VIGETTVVCKIIDHNKGGAVVETDRIVDISELHGMPFSKGVVDDINCVFRPVYDTPFGLLVWLAVPFIFVWATPLWKTSYFDCNVMYVGHVFGKPEYGYCGDEKGDWDAAVADGATVYEEVVGGLARVGEPIPIRLLPRFIPASVRIHGSHSDNR